MNQLLKEVHAALTAYAEEGPEVNDLLGRIEKALAAPVQQEQEHWEEQPDGSVIPVDPSEMQPAPVQQEPVAFDSAPERMKPFLTMHGIATQEFNAFHVGFCCGEDFVKEQPAQQEHYRALEQSLTRLQKRYGEIEASLQHELLRPGFAGVTLWLGDATVTRTVTEPEIRSERLQGAALRDAAEKCLAVYDGARGQS